MSTSRLVVATVLGAMLGTVWGILIVRHLIMGESHEDKPVCIQPQAKKITVVQPSPTIH